MTHRLLDRDHIRPVCVTQGCTPWLSTHLQQPNPRCNKASQSTTSLLVMFSPWSSLLHSGPLSMDIIYVRWTGWLLVSAALPECVLVKAQVLCAVGNVRMYNHKDPTSETTRDTDKISESQPVGARGRLGDVVYKQHISLWQSLLKEVVSELDEDVLPLKYSSGCILRV